MKKEAWDQKCNLSPSLICLDMCHLLDQISILESKGINMIHIDVIDGHFSPSMPLGFETIRQLRAATDLFFDCHVMAESQHLDYFIDELLNIGVQHICFHAETCPHIDATLNKIKSAGVKTGIALKPATPLSVCDYVLEKCDSVLLMLINPGFAQINSETQVSYASRKIFDTRKIIHDRNLNTKIIIDGRVSCLNIQSYAKLVDIFVCGTSCLDRKSIAESAAELIELRDSLISFKEV